MDFLEAWDGTCSEVGRACRIGDAAALKALLAAGRPVDVADNRGWRPLHEAASNGHLECVRLLCCHEDTNVLGETYDNESALVLSARGGHVDVCRMLVEKGASLNATDLLVECPAASAIRRDHFACVQYLVEADCDIEWQDYNDSTLLHLAVEFFRPQVVDLLLSRGAAVDKVDEYGRTALFLAAEIDSPHCLNNIIKEADKRGVLADLVNMAASDGTTPLMIAAHSGSYACVKSLLDHGGNPNAIGDDLSMALHLAVFGKSIECLQLVLEKTDRTTLGSVSWHPNCRKYRIYDDEEGVCPCHACGSMHAQNRDLSDFRSPFHIAVEMGSSDVLRCLLDSDLNPNEFLADDENQLGSVLVPLQGHPGMMNVVRWAVTALGLAAKLQNLEMLRLLLDGGCLPDPNGGHIGSVLPALTIATCRPWPDGIKLLLERGADPNLPMRLSSRLPNFIFVFDGASWEKVLLQLRRAGADMRLMFSSLADIELEGTEWLYYVAKRFFKLIKACKRKDNGHDFNSQLLDSLGTDLFVQLKRMGPAGLADNLAETYPQPSLMQMSAIVVRNAIQDCRPPSAFVKSVQTLGLPPTLVNYVALRNDL